MTSQLQDQLNFDIELTSTISALTKRYLSSYKQIQVTNQIKEKANSFIIVETATNVSLRAVTSSSQVPTISKNNTFFFYIYLTYFEEL